MRSPQIRKIGAATAFVLAIAVSRHGHAQPGKDAKLAAELFQQGRDAMKRGDHAAACAKFEESQRATEAPGTLLNLAACNEKLGKLNQTLEALRSARSLLPPGDGRIEYIDKEIARTEPRVPRLTIRVQAGLDDAIVSVDGEPVAQSRLKAPLLLDPGRHEIGLTAPGHEDTTSAVELAEGATETLALRPGKSAGQPPAASTAATQSAGTPPPPSEPPPSEARDGGSGRRTAAYVAFGVGGLGLVVGGITGVLMLNKKSEMEANCDSDFACNPAGLEAALSGQTFATISTVSFIAGAVGAGVGTYLLLSSDGDSTTAVGVSSNARGASIELRHRF